MPTPVVAIIDDDPVISQVIERLLQRHGYTTRRWLVDANVHQLIIDSRPDLLILDLSLGDISGWQVLQMVRQDTSTRHTPVIVCSGDTGQLQEQAPRLRGMGCEVIEKPFDIQRLLAIVGALVGTAPFD